MIALVTGANGFVGSNMVKLLLEQGLEVRCLVRQTSHLDNLKGLKVKYFFGTLNDENSLIPALEDVDYVFHFAGKTKAVTMAEYIEVNALGVENLARACLKFEGKIKMFVYCSSLAAAGPQSDDSPIKEDLIPAPVTIYGHSKLKGEQLLREVLANEIPFTIIRPTAVYGPDDTEIFPLFKAANLGLRFIFGDEQRKISVIFVRDLVRLCWLAAQKSPPGEIFNASDGSGYTWEGLSNLIAQALHKRGIIIKVPFKILKIFSFLFQLWGTVKGRAVTLNGEKIKEVTAPGWVCSIDKAKTMLNFAPEFDALRGINETVKWYKENNWL